MTKREARKAIYREMALTLRADISDKGSWIYYEFDPVDSAGYSRSEEDIKALKEAAEEIAADYLDLHGG